MSIRRVVTGHSLDGKAIVASDSAVAPVTIALRPGLEAFRLWGGDQAPVFPDAGGASPAVLAKSAPVGGFRFGVFTIGPDSTPAPKDLDMQVAMAEYWRTIRIRLARKLPMLACM